MKILNSKQNIDFMGKRQIALVFSLVLITIAVGSIVARGLSLGIDFTGGTLIEVGYSEPANLDRCARPWSIPVTATARYNSSERRAIS